MGTSGEKMNDLKHGVSDIVATVKSVIFVGHLISCISWVGQSRNLRSQGNRSSL